jgi:hypothetical protein
MKIRNTLQTALLTTAAAATVAGFTTIAAAQTMQNPPAAGSAKPEAGQSGKTIEQKGGLGGAVKYQQNGAQPGEKSPGTPGPSAQEGAKPGQRTDQNSAQSENSPGGKSTEQKGAQTEPGKAGIGATQQNAQEGAHGGATSHGASVQLSQDQKSRIGTMITKGAPARVTSNVDFDIAVGATVPRTVHVVALPQDIVQVVPQYEGYDYIVVRDQILIVDPDDMQIVAVIET